MLGKNTVVKELMTSKELHHVVTATTRKRRYNAYPGQEEDVQVQLDTCEDLDGYMTMLGELFELEI